MIEAPQAIQDVLSGLLQYEEILGALAVSVEGLVMGSAGIDGEDADMLAALGASLVGVAERTMRRIGAGAPSVMCIGAGDGMVHIRGRDEVALIIISEPCDATLIGAACEAALARIAAVVGPVVAVG
ncbi:MAG: roadblock/LC7 domain-containing protein [Thermomicrobiales bacterium]